MNNEVFLRYIGPREVHDGRIAGISREGDRLSVQLVGYNGERFSVEFSGVCRVHSVRAEGMLLYALIEMRSESADYRKFVCGNWHDDDDATLEVDAKSVSHTPPAP